MYIYVYICIYLHTYYGYICCIVLQCDLVCVMYVC